VENKKAPKDIKMFKFGADKISTSNVPKLII
jgi:hypothetical protein